jgi:hypothetical protein
MVAIPPLVPYRLGGHRAARSFVVRSGEVGVWVGIAWALTRPLRTPTFQLEPSQCLLFKRWSRWTRFGCWQERGDTIILDALSLHSLCSCRWGAASVCIVEALPERCTFQHLRAYRIPGWLNAHLLVFRVFSLVPTGKYQDSTLS